MLLLQSVTTYNEKMFGVNDDLLYWINRDPGRLYIYIMGVVREEKLKLEVKVSHRLGGSGYRERK